MIRLLVVLVAMAAVAAALAGSNADEKQPRNGPRPTWKPPTPSTTPAAASLSLSTLDQQDRVDGEHRLREARAFDGRRLLTALPVEHAGVRIDIAGLGSDARTTVLSISPGERSREAARAIYRRILASHGDPGTSYRLRWQR